MTICIECGSETLDALYYEFADRREGPYCHSCYDIIWKKRLREVDRRKTQRRILVGRRSNPGRRVSGMDRYHEVYDGLYSGRRNGNKGRRKTESSYY